MGNEIILAAQCKGYLPGTLKRCGRWNSVQTTNARTYRLKCPCCGSEFQLMGAHGFNLKVKYPSEGQQLNNLIKQLNENENKQ